MKGTALFIAPLVALLAACATPQPTPPLRQGEAEVRQLLLVMDRDHNGKVGRDEFTRYMSAAFTRLDVNHDDALDVAELSGLEPQHSRVASAAPTLRGEGAVVQVLTLMDRDADGKVSRTEFMGFMAAEFDRLDVNHDGELDVPELADLRIKPRKPGGGSK